MNISLSLCGCDSVFLQVKVLVLIQNSPMISHFLTWTLWEKDVELDEKRIVEKNSKKDVKKFFRKKNKKISCKKKYGQKKKSRYKKKFFFENFFVLKNTKINIVKRKINIFTKFLDENNPETMTDPPVE